MTNKELLYIDDSLSHTKELVDICNYYKEQMDDEQLKQLIDTSVNSLNNNYTELYKLLGGE